MRKPVGTRQPRGTPSAWERRRRRIGAEIERAALRLFAARGFDAVTVNDIAAAAGMSERTFFRYFATKEDVVLALPRRVLTKECTAAAARPASESPLTALRNAMLGVDPLIEEEGEAILRWAQVLARTPDMLARVSGANQLAFTEALQRVLALRLGVKPDRDPRPGVIAAAVVGAVQFTFHRWVTGGGTGDLVAMVAETFDTLGDGLERAGRPVAVDRSRKVRRRAAG